MEKTTFLMCKEWEQHLKLLSMEQRGELLTAIMAYQNRAEIPNEDPAVCITFSFMQTFFDKSASEYETRCNASRENGKKGGRPKNPQVFTGTEQKPKEPSKSLYGSDSGSDSGSVPPTEGERKRTGKPRFATPTLAEVTAYVAERKSVVDPQGFIDFYAAKGWLVGKTPMKDWKAACRNAEHWERWGPVSTEKPTTHAESFAERAARMKGAVT